MKRFLVYVSLPKINKNYKSHWRITSAVLPATWSTASRDLNAPNKYSPLTILSNSGALGNSSKHSLFPQARKMEDNTPSHARAPSSGRIKNKAPAKVQITAEQLLREAWEHKESGPTSLPKFQISDKEELQEYQREERKKFEMRIVRNRQHTPLWMRYAKWEEMQGNVTRARSIWERAIDNDYRNPAIWQGYAEMEMRGGFVNHARNVLDRAVALLPRVDALWMKYAHMEELMGQTQLARLVYERWVKWIPPESAYFAWIRFELRCGQRLKARGVYERLVAAHPTAYVFAKMARFEERHGEYGHARGVYERATEVLKGEELTARLLIEFARFEERRKQVERVRGIFQFAMEHAGQEEKGEVERAFVRFEKGMGEREVLDELVVGKKREKYEEMVKKDKYNYDAWFDLLALEEACSAVEKVRETYERAVQQKPMVETKAAWRKYIYVWISYAVWTELSCGDIKGAADIYRRCIKGVPSEHRRFSFGKIWILCAQTLVRNGDVAGARRVFGSGIGVLATKERIYRAYVEMEKGLGEFGRVRRVYERWLENMPSKGEVFLEYAQLENDLGEVERAWGILEVARTVEGVSRLEEIWEMSLEVGKEVGKGGDELFEEYVKTVKGGKPWVTWAKEVEERGGTEEEVREVFRRGERFVRGAAVEGGVAVEEVSVVVGEWMEWERSVGGKLDGVRKLMPKRVKRTRRIRGVVEEYWEHVLPMDSSGGGTQLLVEAAKRWKMAAAK